MAASNTKIRIVISRREILRHACVWLLILCFMLIAALEVNWPFWFSVATQTPYWILYITAFYGSLYQACPFWHQHRIVFLFRGILAFALFLVGYVSLDLTIPEYVPEGEAQPTYPLWSHMFDATYMFIFIQINVLGLYFQKYHVERIKDNSQREMNLVRQKERLTRQELNFYKSEFNTHITFNTLSHIYAKVMDQSEVAQPVLVLSDILRYNLTVQAHREVALEQELSYIERFIEIHQILFPKLQIDFLIEGKTQNARILPRILIGFVENAIKHGDKSNVNHPIKIQVSVDRHIRFSVTNKKRKRSAAFTDSRKSTKTGIKNVQNTLKAFYQDQYCLEIKEDEHTYQVYLEIDNFSCDLKSTEGALLAVNR